MAAFFGNKGADGRLLLSSGAINSDIERWKCAFCAKEASMSLATRQVRLRSVVLPIIRCIAHSLFYQTFVDKSFAILLAYEKKYKI